MHLSLPRRRLLFLLKLCFSAGILGSLFISLDAAAVKELLNSLELSSFLLATGLMVIQIFIAVYRWKLILEMKGIRLDYLQTLRLFWIGLLFSQFLPSNFGGDAARIYYLAKTSDNVKDVVNSVVLDRFAGLLSLSFLVITTTGVTWTAAGSVITRLHNYFFGLFVLGLLMLISMIVFRQYIDRPFSSRILSFCQQLAADFFQLVRPNQTSLSVWSLSLCIHFITVLSFYILTKALNVEITFFHILWAVPLTLLFSSVPVTISGWGVREWLMIITLGVVGIATEASLAMSVLFGFMLALIAVPGLILWIIHRSANQVTKGNT